MRKVLLIKGLRGTRTGSRGGEGITGSEEVETEGKQLTMVRATDAASFVFLPFDLR